MTLDTPPTTAAPVLWGYCRRCGHTLLAEDVYCPSCGAQRDWS